MALEPMDVKNIIVWLMKLAVAALYYYSASGDVWTALLAAELLEGALTGVWAWMAVWKINQCVVCTKS